LNWPSSTLQLLWVSCPSRKAICIRMMDGCEPWHDPKADSGQSSRKPLLGTLIVWPQRTVLLAETTCNTTARHSKGIRHMRTSFSLDHRITVWTGDTTGPHATSTSVTIAYNRKFLVSQSSIALYTKSLLLWSKEPRRVHGKNATESGATKERLATTTLDIHHQGISFCTAAKDI
jgi:hypothetical protein